MLTDALLHFTILLLWEAFRRETTSLKQLETPYPQWINLSNKRDAHARPNAGFSQPWALYKWFQQWQDLDLLLFKMNYICMGVYVFLFFQHCNTHHYFCMLYITVQYSIKRALLQKETSPAIEPVPTAMSALWNMKEQITAPREIGS